MLPDTIKIRLFFKHMYTKCCPSTYQIAGMQVLLRVGICYARHIAGGFATAVEVPQCVVSTPSNKVLPLA